MGTVKHPIRPHLFEAETEIRGKRKIITYLCRARGCQERGRISCIPASAADGIFALFREIHDEHDSPVPFGDFAEGVLRNVKL